MLGELATQHARDHGMDALEHAIRIGNVVFADEAMRGGDGVDFTKRPGLYAGAAANRLLGPGPAIDVRIPCDIEIGTVRIEMQKRQRAAKANDRLLPLLLAVDAPVPDALIDDRPARVGVRPQLGDDCVVRGIALGPQPYQQRLPRIHPQQNARLCGWSSAAPDQSAAIMIENRNHYGEGHEDEQAVAMDLEEHV